MIIFDVYCFKSGILVTNFSPSPALNRRAVSGIRAYPRFVLTFPSPGGGYCNEEDRRSAPGHTARFLSQPKQVAPKMDGGIGSEPSLLISTKITETSE